MRFGIDTAQQRVTWAELVERVRLAEDLGFEAVWLFDHFKPMYGEGPGPCFEAWTSLAALAASTTRVRLAVLVTGMTYRPPSLLATEVVTIDHVSNGRVELAVGAAWFEEEHRELGIDFPPTRERLERLEEGIEVMRLLMTTDNATFEGQHYRLAGATYHPRPVQQPHPPIWIGGSGERRTLPLVGRVADGWHAFDSPRQLARKWEIVREHAERAGRDPAGIVRAGSLSLDSLDDTRRHLDKHLDAGTQYLVCGWPGEGPSRVEKFAAEFLSA